MEQALRRMTLKLSVILIAVFMAVLAVPALAFADATSGSFTLRSNEMTVTAGTNTGNVSNLIDSYAALPAGEATHFDYVVTSGDAISVNKHSGVVTASEVTTETTATVTVYLMSQATHTNDPHKPCANEGIIQLASQQVTVTVQPSSSYGYQGNSMMLKMTSPTVSSFSGSNNASVGWTNQLAASTPVDGYYYFTVKLSNGFSRYNTPLLFAQRNAGYVTVSDSEGQSTYSLNIFNTGNVSIDSVDTTTKTVTIKIASSIVTTGDTQLIFSSAFRGNNDANTLGTPITFVIN